MPILYHLSYQGSPFQEAAASIALAMPVMGFPCGSDSKESACNAGDLGSIPGSGLIRQLFTWRKDRLLIPVFLGFPCGSDSKESACNAGNPGFIPRLGRSPGEGSGTPVFLPGEFHGQRRPAGYSPCNLKESDMIEQLIFLLSFS